MEMKPNPPHTNIPNIFHDHALIRFAGSKSVFVVLNFTMHSFDNVHVFTNRGYDFSDVVGVTKDMELYSSLLRVGDALSH
jgi:hypothetical protein